MTGYHLAFAGPALLSLVAAAAATVLRRLQRGPRSG